jgi:hypothetical protein
VNPAARLNLPQLPPSCKVEIVTAADAYNLTTQGGATDFEAYPELKASYPRDLREQIDRG